MGRFSAEIFVQQNYKLHSSDVGRRKSICV